MILEDGSIRYKNDDQCDNQDFEIVDGVNIYEHLTYIPQLLTSIVKWSRLWWANFSRGCADYLNHICVLAPTCPFIFDNDNVSAAFLFFGQEKQVSIFWSVNKTLRITRWKVREAIKFYSYQDQN